MVLYEDSLVPLFLGKVDFNTEFSNYIFKKANEGTTPVVNVSTFKV